MYKHPVFDRIRRIAHNNKTFDYEEKVKKECQELEDIFGKYLLELETLNDPHEMDTLIDGKMTNVYCKIIDLKFEMKSFRHNEYDYSLYNEIILNRKKEGDIEK